MSEELIQMTFKLTAEEKDKLMLQAAVETQHTGKRVTMAIVLRNFIQSLENHNVASKEK